MEHKRRGTLPNQGEDSLPPDRHAKPLEVDETPARPIGTEPAVPTENKGQDRPSHGAVASPANRGDIIDRYVVLRMLGSGGVGVVLEAWDPELDRKVAMKFLQPKRSRWGPDRRARFLREAQAIAQLAHPNVVAVHDVGSVHDNLFIVMEFVDGKTLSQWMKERHTLDEKLQVFAQAGRGLLAAHKKGIIHRDFKPDNVLIGKDGRARVADFGLARAVEALNEPAMGAQRDGDKLEVRKIEPRLTQTGSIIGTPAYMAPEQYTGEAAHAQADQFAFCVSLYEAVAGQRPFLGETYDELKLSVVAGAVQEPLKDARLPKWLLRLLLRGLSVNPADRFPSMDVLLAEIEKRRTASRIKVPLVATVLVGLIVAGTYAGYRLRGSHIPPDRLTLEERFDAGSTNLDVKEKVAPIVEAAIGMLVPEYTLQCHDDVCRLHVYKEKDQDLGDWVARLQEGEESGQIIDMWGFESDVPTYGPPGQSSYTVWLGFNEKAAEVLRLLQRLVADFERSGAREHCYGKHPIEGTLETRLYVGEDGGSVVFDFRGSLAGTPAGKCIEDRLRETASDFSVPPGLVSAGYILTVTLPVEQ